MLASAISLTACGKEPLYQEQGYVFGTLVEVSIYGTEEARAKQAVATVMQEFQRLHNLLHAWKPSALSELNAALAQGKTKEVSSELAAILRDAAQLSAQSDNLFNPAIGGMVQLWGFHADEFQSALPDQKKLAVVVAAKPQMSDLIFHSLPLSPSRLRPPRFALPASGRGVLVSSRNSAVQLDLGGYAKGYALDSAVALLKQQGISNALINIGGNVLALGAHGARAWRVGIQHPRQPGPIATLELHDGEAIGTSGDYQHYFMVGGQRYCHLIDPRSGQPVQGVQAVTVLTRGDHAGVRSDAVSKPLFISGRAAWRNAAKQMGLTEALLIDGHGIIHLTTAMQKRLEFVDKKMVPEMERVN
ncbi:MAG: FAD:protein FMN transferase [Gallionellaceae bacterium]|nr:FAD:protein FMN transferase [Gallionellaceae bacterium]